LLINGGKFKRHINRENLLGCQGELASHFNLLLESLWNTQSIEEEIPQRLKAIVGKKIARFSGSAHEDAHEFMLALLNLLHEVLSIINFQIIAD